MPHLLRATLSRGILKKKSSLLPLGSTLTEFGYVSYFYPPTIKLALTKDKYAIELQFGRPFNTVVDFSLDPDIIEFTCATLPELPIDDDDKKAAAPQFPIAAGRHINCQGPHLKGPKSSWAAGTHIWVPWRFHKQPLSCPFIPVELVCIVKHSKLVVQSPRVIVWFLRKAVDPTLEVQLLSVPCSARNAVLAEQDVTSSGEAAEAVDAGPGGVTKPAITSGGEVVVAADAGEGSDTGEATEAKIRALTIGTFFKLHFLSRRRA